MIPSATYRQPVRNGAEVTSSNSDVPGSVRAESVPVQCHHPSTVRRVSGNSKVIKGQLLSNNNHPPFTGSVHDGASTDGILNTGSFSRQVSPLMQVSLPSLPPASFADQVSAVECHKPDDFQSLLPYKTDNSLSFDLGRTKLQLPVYERWFIQHISKTLAEGKEGHCSSKIASASASASTSTSISASTSASASASASASKPMRRFTAQQRARHNRREKKRVLSIGHYTEKLRELIPSNYLTKPRSKLSKLQVLTMASSYIKELSSQLEKGAETDKSSA